VPCVSTRVGQVSKQLPRVTILLVHVSTGGPHIGMEHLTSGPHTCHMALTYWSTSAATSPDRDTWHNAIGANLHVSTG
jgi:hypothetical protein